MHVDRESVFINSKEQRGDKNITDVMSWWESAWHSRWHLASDANIKIFPTTASVKNSIFVVLADTHASNIDLWLYECSVCLVRFMCKYIGLWWKTTADLVTPKSWLIIFLQITIPFLYFSRFHIWKSISGDKINIFFH